MDLTFSNAIVLIIFLSQIAFLYYLRQIALRNTANEDERKHINKGWNKVIVTSIVYLAIIISLAINGFFSIPTMPPRFPLILLPHFVFMFFLFGFKINKQLAFLKIIPLHVLVFAQFFRLVLEFAIDF